MIMKCRNNVAELTLVQKSQLVQAFLDLKNPARALAGSRPRKPR
jgi:hypothetical protein